MKYIISAIIFACVILCAFNAESRQIWWYSDGVADYEIVVEDGQYGYVLYDKEGKIIVPFLLFPEYNFDTQELTFMIPEDPEDKNENYLLDKTLKIDYKDFIIEKF